MAIEGVSSKGSYAMQMAISEVMISFYKGSWTPSARVVETCRLESLDEAE